MLPPGTVTPTSPNATAHAAVNADPGELAKFSAAAHTWWDLDGQFKPLHRINPLRLGWLTQFVHWPDTAVLDMGCGGGILSDAMARKGARVTGADLSAKALAVARLHALEAQSPPVDYREISAEALAQELPAHFDVVTCMEMLEHVPDPASIVQACARLVKPGGWVFFSTLSRTPTTYLTAILGAEYLLKLVPRGTHDYEKLIRPSELARFIRQSGLEVQSSIGLHYNPLSDRFWLAKGTSANYMVAAKRPTL